MREDDRVQSVPEAELPLPVTHFDGGERGRLRWKTKSGTPADDIRVGIENIQALFIAHHPEFVRFLYLDGKKGLRVLPDNLEAATAFILEKVGTSERLRRVVGNTVFNRKAIPYFDGSYQRVLSLSFGPLGLNLVIPVAPLKAGDDEFPDLPRDKRGRILWEQLATQDTKKIEAAIEQEGERLHSLGIPLNYNYLVAAGRHRFIYAAEKYYPGRFPKVVTRVAEIGDRGITRLEDVPVSASGRINWSGLKNYSEDLIKLLDLEALKFVEAGHQLTHIELGKFGSDFLKNGIRKLYAGDIHGIRIKLGFESIARIRWEPEDIRKDLWEFYQQHGVVTNQALKDLGIATGRTPIGCWTDEVMKKALIELLERRGNLLPAMVKQEGSLYTAMTKRPGGVLIAIRDFGLETNYYPESSFTPDVIEQQALGFYEQYGDLSYTLLRSHDRGYLASVIHRLYPGKITDLKAKLGIPTRYKRPSPDARVQKQDLERYLPEDMQANSDFPRDKAGGIRWGKIQGVEQLILQLARGFLEKHGEISQSMLKRQHALALQPVINKRYPGGLAQITTDLGIEPKQRPKNYWTPETVESKARELLKAGVQLTSAELKKRGLSGMLEVVSKYYGGLRGLNEFLGQETTAKPNGYWKSLDNIEREAAAFYQKNGVLTNNALEREGHAVLCGAINKYYPGRIFALRKKLGIETTRKPRGYWRGEVSASIADAKLKEIISE